jgi:hypothetical protein
VAKDRAAPFSRKHRRYWIPVTGGMILIGAINITIGLCTQREPPAPSGPIEPGIAHPPADAAGTIGAAELPVPVMRAFNQRYPRTLAAGASMDRAAGTFTVILPADAGHHSATFRADGTFVSED